MASICNEKIDAEQKVDDLLKTSYAHYGHSLVVNVGSANVG